ncbi:MAG: hypothetical protein Q9168_004462 [Polycauliona sp. 1 TL-2023]
MSSFLGLPAEVRNMIYEYCLVVNGEIVPYPAEYEYPRFKPKHVTAQQLNYMNRKPDVALLQVNKQVREETCPVLYGRNVWRMSGTWDSESTFDQFTAVKRHFNHMVTSLDSRDLGHAYFDVGIQSEIWKRKTLCISSIKDRRKAEHSSRTMDLDETWYTRMDFLHGDRSGLKILTVDISNSWCPFGCCRMFGAWSRYSLSYFDCSVMLRVRGIFDEDEAWHIQRGFRLSSATLNEDAGRDPSLAGKRLGNLEKEKDGSYTLMDDDEYRHALERELQEDDRIETEA